MAFNAEAGSCSRCIRLSVDRASGGASDAGFSGLASGCGSTASSSTSRAMGGVIGRGCPHRLRLGLPPIPNSLANFFAGLSDSSCLIVCRNRRCRRVDFGVRTEEIVFVTVECEFLTADNTAHLTPHEVSHDSGTALPSGSFHMYICQAAGEGGDVVGGIHDVQVSVTACFTKA